ncbi:MAG: mechanosensitive ion channel [Pirellulaceae bacterium]
MIQRSSIYLLFLVMLGVLTTGPQNLFSQEEAPKQDDALVVPAGKTEDITAESIAKSIAQIQANTELDEATKSSLMQIYTNAQKALDAAKSSTDKIAEYERMIQTSPTQMATLKEQNMKLRQTATTNYSGQSTEQLKQALVQKQTEVSAAKQQIDTLQGEPARRLKRTGALPTEIADLEQKLSENARQSSEPAPANESEIVTTTRKAKLAAEKIQLSKQLDEAKAEQRFYQATSELLPLQIENATIKKERVDKELAGIQARVANAQKSAIERSLEEAKVEQRVACEALQPLANRNVELAELQQRYHLMILRNEQELTDVKKTIAEVDDLRKRLEDKVNAIGLTDALTVSINRQRLKLLEIRDENRPDPKLKELLTDIQVQAFDLEDDIDEINQADFLNTLKAAIESSGANTAVRSQNGQQPVVVEDVVQSEYHNLVANDLKKEGRNDPVSQQVVLAQKYLIPKNKRFLTDVGNFGDSLLTTITELDSQQHLLSQKIDEFLGFIDQRIVWLRSAAPIGLADLKPGAEAAKWFADPTQWTFLASGIQKNLINYAWIYTPAVLGILLLFVFHGRFKRVLSESSLVAKKGRCSDMAPTWNGLLATFVLSLTWPFMMLVLGMLLNTPVAATELSAALGDGLYRTSFYLFTLELLRRTCREDGLAECHFGWPKPLTVSLRANLHWYYAAGIPALVLLWTLEFQSEEAWKNSLGRLAAIAYFGATAFLMHRIFQPSGKLFQFVQTRHENSQFFHFRYLVYVLFVGIPIMLLFLTISGYHYTAVILTSGFNNTCRATIVLVLVGGVLLRWLLMKRRAAAIEEARKLRQLQQGTPAEPVVAENAAISIPDNPVVDLANVTRQAREVVVFALSSISVVWLFWIWRDALPAVEYLEENRLWSWTVNDRVEIVSWRDGLFAMVSFLLTFIMIKNMPGLLNLAAQRFSSFDAGTRYAATTIFRYLITIIGVVTGLSFLSIPWSQYSWVVAAATVGLGFGLQEIVANFVSGLILLFERPVRVGDWITIDDTTGVVTKIQMRATTVTNWDNQELVVPNKDLITGKLLNWTLSSVVTRLVINVGVAYGSDVEKVHRILMEIVKGNADILDTPAPTVVLEEFADSSLNFVVRCHLTSVEERMRVKHELNTEINRRFIEEGIVIPFPQRDLHIITQPGFGPKLAATDDSDSV